MPEVTDKQLRRWAVAAHMADSYMSLAFHRGGITKWDTPATPSSEVWQDAMHKARAAWEEMSGVLADTAEVRS